MKDRDKELLGYMDYIHRLAINNSKEEYTNSDPDKAAIVFNELFSNSSKELKIYAGSMEGIISSKILYISGLRQFLNKWNVKLKILLEDTTKISQNTEMSKLLKQYKKKIEVKKSNIKALRENKEIHFSVGDNIRYRIEVDQENFKAFGSFNDSSEGSALSNFFDSIFNSEVHSSKIDLTFA